MLSNCILNIYVYTYRFAFALLSALVREAFFLFPVRWLVVNTETPNWSKCQKQVSLSARPWMSYHDQSPPSQVSGNMDGNRVKRMGELVAGEENYKTLASGRGMAVAHMTSQMSSGEVVDGYATYTLYQCTKISKNKEKFLKMDVKEALW